MFGHRDRSGVREAVSRVVSAPCVSLDNEPVPTATPAAVAALTGADTSVVASMVEALRAEAPTAQVADAHVAALLLARTRQQHVVTTSSRVVELAPAGSFAEAYRLDADGRPTHVWYASYGSNLYADRMNVYIDGGTPPGRTTVYTGARNRTPIVASIPITLPGTVHYAGHSHLWGGAVAFLDTHTAVHGCRSLGRAHLMAVDQFDDVVFQESHGAQVPDGTPVDLGTTLQHGRAVEPGLYGTLVHVGDHTDEHGTFPVVTFTGPFTTADALRGDLVITPEGHLAPAAGREQVQAEQRAAQAVESATAAVEGREPVLHPADWPIVTAAPSAAYVAMIGGGLVETHGLDEEQVRAYFAGATGCQPLPALQPEPQSEFQVGPVVAARTVEQGSPGDETVLATQP